MKGGWRFQPWQHFRGEKSSQTNEEEIRSTTLGLSHHRGEELELAGEWYSEWLGWQEVQCLDGCRALVSVGVTIRD
jgi:hypothetical protein